LGSEGEKPADIHRRMKRQYGDACVSLQQVYEWHRKFKSGGVSRDDEIKEAVHRWLCSQSEEFLSHGIQALVKRWHICIERGGDYVEK
jgi:hypothetical protein